MTVKAIGIGGIGCCFIINLARYLNYGYDRAKLVLIDGDTFEERNQDRQLARSFDNKAQSVADQVKAFGFDNLTVLSRNEYVTEENIDEHIEEGDIVFLSVDNHATRRCVSEYVTRYLNTVTVISGGNELTTGEVQVHVRKDGINETLPIANDFHPEIRDAHDTVLDHIGCRQMYASKPQLLITNNAIAAHMLTTFYACIAGTVMYDELYVDILSGNTLAVRRRPAKELSE